MVIRFFICFFHLRHKANDLQFRRISITDFIYDVLILDAEC